MDNHSPFYSTFPRSELSIPLQPTRHLSLTSITNPPLSPHRFPRDDQRSTSTSSSPSSRHLMTNNVSSLLNHQSMPQPIFGAPSSYNPPSLLRAIPPLTHGDPIGPILIKAMSSGAGRHGSPVGPSGSGHDQKEDDSKSHKKRTRLNADQGALLKKVWRETYFPSTELRSWLAGQTGLTVRQVQVWFQNQRQKQTNEEKEASKSCSADAPHCVSGPRVAFDGSIPPRDLLEQLYRSQGWSTIGSGPDIRRRGSEDRPATPSSGRPLTAEGRVDSVEHEYRSRETRETTAHAWRQAGPVDAEFALPVVFPPPPLPQPIIWEHSPLSPYSSTSKRSREEYEMAHDRPIEMYRSTAHLSESNDDPKLGSVAPDRLTRLPSIRELGLNAYAQM